MSFQLSSSPFAATAALLAGSMMTDCGWKRPFENPIPLPLVASSLVLISSNKFDCYFGNVRPLRCQFVQLHSLCALRAAHGQIQLLLSQFIGDFGDLRFVSWLRF